MEKVLYKARKEKVIESCRDCPNVIGGWSGWGLGCKRDKEGRGIGESCANKTLPDWCPLPSKQESQYIIPRVKREKVRKRLFSNLAGVTWEEVDD